MEPHKLNDQWSLYYQQIEGEEIKNYQSTIHLIDKFDTIEKFWSLFSHVVNPLDLNCKCQIQIFRKNIRALWEDEANAQGGRFFLGSDRANINAFWQKAVILLIGENLNEIIQGITVSSRESAQKFLISFWTSSSPNPEELEKIANELGSTIELPKNFELFYQSHSNKNYHMRFRIKK